MAVLSYVLAAGYWSLAVILAIVGLRRTARVSTQLARAARAQGLGRLVPPLRRIAREAVEGIAAWLMVTAAALVMCWLAVG